MTEKKQPVEAVLEIAKKLPLFRTPEGTVYATIPEGDVELFSTELRSWLKREAHRQHKVFANNFAVTDALDILPRGEELPVQQLHVRTAGTLETGIFIDNVGTSGGVIHVTSEGWGYVTNCPYKFKRPAGQLPLPEPKETGTLTALYSLPFQCSDEDKKLLAAWLLGALCPFIPHPILVLEGAPGSGKSTAARMCRQLVDNSTGLLNTLPKERRDLALTAQLSNVVALDNIGPLSRELSDTLCSMATGGVFETRKLREDTEVIRLPLANPVILTGLSGTLKRPDVMHRSIILKFNAINSSRVIDELSLQTVFAAVASEIFGALLNALSEALRNWPAMTLEKTPRMADFARLACAAATTLQATEAELVGALLDVQTSQQADAAEATFPIEVLKRVVTNSGKQEWTAGELATAIKADREGSRLGITRNNVVGALTDMANALENSGIEFRQHARTGQRRGFILRVVLPPVTMPMTLVTMP